MPHHAEVLCQRVRIDETLWLRMLEGCVVAGIRLGRLVWGNELWWNSADDTGAPWQKKSPRTHPPSPLRLDRRGKSTKDELHQHPTSARERLTQVLVRRLGSLVQPLLASSHRVHRPLALTNPVPACRGHSVEKKIARLGQIGARASLRHQDCMRRYSATSGVSLVLL